MTQTEYAKAKQECLSDFCKEHGFIETADVKGIFGYAFDRAYALGKQFGNSEQVNVEKAAERYADEIRIPASIPGVMVPFINGLAHDAYLQGAQDCLGKKEKDAEDTVISGWVARDEGGFLGLYSWQPKRSDVAWIGDSCMVLPINTFPDLTWESEPEPVEIIIKRKNKNL